jgi:tRNA1(Val) A37 N6-methylase TrmN6
MEELIADIKSDFRSEISLNDPIVKKQRKLSGELFQMTQQTQLFEMSKKEKADWNKKVLQLTEETKKLEKDIEEIKSNKIFENAFEWRFEFPEVLNDDGDYVGFDIILGNPPYVQLSKTADLTEDYKRHLLMTYETSGGRLNTFIFFIHLSNKILHSKGILNFIIPNTILSQEYYSFTRDFLINKVELTELVNFPVLLFEDAVVETVLIQFSNSISNNTIVDIKELSKEGIKPVSQLIKDVINRDSKFSFVYTLNPIIEKVFNTEHILFGSICDINQGIALKGDKSLSLKKTKENDNYYKLLDGRNINKYSINWDGVYLDYDLERIHSCKRKDIFESSEKLMFRRVSSTLIFTYDDSEYFALNTLVIVNKIDVSKGPELKFILGIMNSKLMNYVYGNKFKSTKTVFGLPNKNGTNFLGRIVDNLF